MKTQISVVIRIEEEDGTTNTLSTQRYLTADEAIAFINKNRTDLPAEVINELSEHGVDNIAETFAENTELPQDYEADYEDFSGASEDNGEGR